MTKYIFVTGGVISSVGKGITTASLGRLLIDRGYQVMALKIDPYINVDAGTMDPFQHGEVFVTNDGAETDLDLGHYERYLGIDLTKYSNFTSGSVYSSVIECERTEGYGGQTVQLIPHITDEIKSRIYQLAKDSGCDILITEIGGTIGDFEMPPFVEAITQIGMEVGRANALYIHVSLLISLYPSGETKTKATQHSARALRELGVHPDIIICRTRKKLDMNIRQKLATHCKMSPEAFIEGKNTNLVEEIPLKFAEQGLASIVLKRLALEDRPPVNDAWRQMVHKLKNPSHEVEIVMAGKYTKGTDAYISVVEALKHGGIANEAVVKIRWVDTEGLAKNSPDSLDKKFKNASGILVPGGYGQRGIEGMIHAVKYARENSIPFLGLCLGMQCMVVEFARNVANLKGANSTEFDDKTPHPVISLLAEQKNVKDIGGTQRKGIFPCELQKDSRAYQAYGQPIILERHRHRREFNNEYRNPLAQKGLIFSGLCPDGDLVEIVELKDHPWMVASQFHPEFKSKPLSPHPLFRDFIKAALQHG